MVDHIDTVQAIVFWGRKRIIYFVWTNFLRKLVATDFNSYAFAHAKIENFNIDLRTPENESILATELKLSYSELTSIHWGIKSRNFRNTTYK